MNKYPFLPFFFAVLILIAGASHSQTLLKDDFLYNPVDSLENTGGWYRSGLNTPYNIKVVSPGLTYAGYAGSGRGNTVSFSNSGEGDIVFHNLTVQSSGTVYLAFMVRVDSLGSNTTQGNIVGFNPNGGTSLSSSLQIRKVTSGTFNFGVRKRLVSTYSATAYNTGTTYLAVIKYRFVAGSTTDDSVKLFIFSSGVPATEPASPTVFNKDTLDMVNIGSVYITNNYAQGTLNGSGFKIDGIRIGNSWASSVLSSVSQISSELPASYSLGQNYPNPFNPSTSIIYSVKQTGNVTLRVFDALGREAGTLVDELQLPGTYKAVWNGEGLSSGMYYYRLTSGTFSETKRMMLLK
ncbi:MAG: T9SS type A sorting domain-containing protein [Ignavibacteria bacterium]|nr:T9SS type A sorting domain-containing protein [Ignavibacteria bacterium]